RADAGGGGARGGGKVWGLPDGKLLRRVSPGGYGYVFSPDGKTMAFRDGETRKAHLWDVDAGREIATLPRMANGCLFSPDGRTLVTGGYRDMLHLWDAATGRPLRACEGRVGNGTYPLCFSADGKRLASWTEGSDRGIRLWDVDRGTELRPFGGHQFDVSALGFSADGTKLVSGGDDRTARVWEA